jgi:hypothetical protein
MQISRRHRAAASGNMSSLKKALANSASESGQGNGVRGNREVSLSPGSR